MGSRVGLAVWSCVKVEMYSRMSKRHLPASLTQTTATTLTRHDLEYPSELWALVPVVGEDSGEVDVLLVDLVAGLLDGGLWFFAFLLWLLFLENDAGEGVGSNP